MCIGVDANANFTYSLLCGARIRVVCGLPGITLGVNVTTALSSFYCFYAPCVSAHSGSICRRVGIAESEQMGQQDRLVRLTININISKEPHAAPHAKYCLRFIRVRTDYIVLPSGKVVLRLPYD